jgi:hypothetical protein
MNSVITLVGDVEVAGPILSHPSWEIQSGSGCHATIAGEAFPPIACYSADHPGSIDLTNALIGGVGDIEVAGLIHRYSKWSAQTGARGCGMVTRKAGVPIARHRRNNPAALTLRMRLLKASAM